MAEHRGGSGNFAEDKEKASEAGRKGGQHSGGNFKNDPQRASEAGKKGGQNNPHRLFFRYQRQKKSVRSSQVWHIYFMTLSVNDYFIQLPTNPLLHNLLTFLRR